MYKVLFVCTGNICRSPTAEGIMKHLVSKENLSGKIYVDSAGTHAWHEGNAPDFRSTSCAKSFGIDISEQRSRPIKAEDFEIFDMILIMDEKNLTDLRLFVPRSTIKAEIHKLLEFAPTYGVDVPDPYFNNGFDFVFEMISIACDNLLKDIKSKL